MCVRFQSRSFEFFFFFSFFTDLFFHLLSSSSFKKNYIFYIENFVYDAWAIVVCGSYDGWKCTNNKKKLINDSRCIRAKFFFATQEIKFYLKIKRRINWYFRKLCKLQIGLVFFLCCSPSVHLSEAGKYERTSKPPEQNDREKKIESYFVCYSFSLTLQRVRAHKTGNDYTTNNIWCVCCFRWWWWW